MSGRLGLDFRPGVFGEVRWSALWDQIVTGDNPSLCVQHLRVIELVLNWNHISATHVRLIGRFCTWPLSREYTLKIR